MRTLFAAAVVVAIAGPAVADPLPPMYRGHWCAEGEAEAERQDYGRGRCDGEFSDGNMTVTATGYSAHEQRCRFVSIRRTGVVLPNSTKPTKADWTPVIKVTARCRGMAETWMERQEWSYSKGVLVLRGKK